MTAAARYRYLDVLGFRPRDDRPEHTAEEEPNAVTDEASHGREPNPGPSPEVIDEDGDFPTDDSSPGDFPTDDSSPGDFPTDDFLGDDELDFEPGADAGWQPDSKPSADSAPTDATTVNTGVGVPTGPAKRPDSGSTTHVLWSSTDGDWERAYPAAEPGTPATSSDDPETLAGTVAIDTTNELDEAWSRFKRSGAQRDRDELIVYYAPLVKYVASRIAAGLPQTVDQSDLVSYGMFGLIDAIAKFDPDRGFKFETYAISRIKGAILDELRAIDWVPRSVRSKAKSVERAMSKLETKLHRAPTDEEIAKEMDITGDQLSGIYKQISTLGVVALDEMLSFNGSESLTFGDTLADRREGPVTTYERVEMRQLLAEAINKMNEREKIVLTLYYYENLTLAEIGRVLGVTESRVCQIHTKAVLQLRSRLAASEREMV